MAPGIPVAGAAPTGAQGEMPMMNMGMVPGAAYQAPVTPAAMPNPAWGQPPSNPPPVPPPNQLQAPDSQSGPMPAVTAQPKSGQVGNDVSTVVSVGSFPQSGRTQTAEALRRQSRQQSSYLALMFLFGAALFLVGVVIVLIISLMG